jgi:hypothetical protein
MGFGGTGGGGGNSIASASDATLNNPVTNDVLKYDGTSGKWKNGVVVSTGAANNIMVVKYASGAYPALPTSKPSGVELILFKGPVQPTSLPSYAGDGASQIMADYEYRNLV